MADHKEYINQTLENGNVMISEDVIETIVAHAVGEVEGVAGLSNAKSRGKSMKITISQDDELSIECNIIVIYGQSVFDAAKAVQAAVTGAVKAMTGIEVKSINVNVTGIIRQ